MLVHRSPALNKSFERIKNSSIMQFLVEMAISAYGPTIGLKLAETG